MLPYDENLILDYIENELGAEDRARFEAMLAEDEPLRLLIEQVIADRDLLRTLPAKEVPAILMEQVQAELERQMLADVAPSRFKVGAAPRSFRIHHRLRWAGALAAAVALAAGLSWHFDLFNGSTSTSTPPIGELAHRDVGDPDGAFDHTSASSAKGRQIDATPPAPQATAQAGETGDENRLANGLSAPLEHHEIKDRSLRQSVEKNGDEAAGAAPATPTPGGKASTALAMAQQAAADDAAPGAAASFNAGGDAPPADGVLAFDDLAKAVDFQIELQTESVSQTREVLLAWAHQNDAVQTSQLSTRRSAKAAAGERQLRAASDELPPQDDQLHRLTETQDAPSPREERQRGNARTQPKMPASADPAGAPLPPPTSDAKAGAVEEAKAEKTEKPNEAEQAKKDMAAKPASSAPAASARGGVDRRQTKLAAPRATKQEERDKTEPDDAAPKAKAAPAPQVITLLVPEDRMDNLVEHIEAKTGQSLVVVRQGDELFLLSPQLANQRALARKEAPESAAAPSVPAPSTYSSQPSADENLGAAGSAKAKTQSAPAPAPAAPVTPAAPATPKLTEPAPAVILEQQPQSEKVQTKKAAVRQVKVKIIIAQEP